jgi:hypothetical protein
VRQRSNRMRGLRTRPGDLAWSVSLVAASVVGGLAAADITRESTVWALAVSLVVAAVSVVALYRGLLDGIRPAYGQHAGPAAGQGPATGQRLPARQGHATEVRASPRAPEDALEDQRAARYVSVHPGLVRVVQQPGGAPWWEEHAPLRSARGAARSAAPRQVDLSRFLGQALIAQCPNCGSFHVEVKNQTEPWSFWCTECRQQWTWQPGTPWPAIAVRPNARGRARPPRA